MSSNNNGDGADEPDHGLVEEVETLKGRVDNIEGRVNDLAEMFETYIDEEDSE